MNKDLVKDVHRLSYLAWWLEDSRIDGLMVHHNSDSSLVVEVKSKKHVDPRLMELKESVLGMINESFSQRRDGVLRYQRILYVPDVKDLRIRILEEAPGSSYSRDVRNLIFLLSFISRTCTKHGLKGI